VFTKCIIATGISAILMSLCTLYDPLGTHPHIADDVMVRGLFGWMMLYLSTLTISLGWHGLMTIRNKGDHLAHRHWFTVGIQIAAIVAAVNCAAQGYAIGQPLMMGIAVVGVASGVTNLLFIFNDTPPRMGYLKEHIKALVGAGISVYTAFMTFGLARLMPSMAFNPTLWAIPIVIGISIIVYHHAKIGLFLPRPVRRAASPAP
jgi:hypothetical protein